MAPLLILGIILALLLVLALRVLVNSPPRVVLRVLGVTLGLALLGAFLFLVVTSRLSWAAGALAALSPWAIWLSRNVNRAARAARAARSARAAFRAFGGGGRGAAADPDPDDRSTVTTRFLDMTLSHATGAMTGTVREGAFAGRSLEDLDRGDALALWREMQSDPESLRVFEAWLDRVHPDWRPDGDEGGAEETGGDGAPGARGPMSRAEALAVLGLEEGAGPEDIKAAHRRLIVLVHPDRGGTPYLAARLNQARDLLLGRDGRRQGTG
ncbi:molecular chaperone DnaJ [Roseospira navarrensis]|uniref:Molecular chaperone DnaJ n=1 Tax=Roseospira navarrensis TaxID=140058 RepID=A0A7X2D404_9PROT|nr:molecular chaperone DnaJ [Roseospira navarrensis]MQX36142.1 molecular chaperone DnaJ [Roseospira navarrensis]